MAFLCTVLILLISSNIDATFAVVRCPVSAEWRLQAGNICPESQQKYVCIFNITDKKYQENCRGPDYSVKGGKLVFNPNFDLRTCDYKRYQPFVFSTISQSDCVFLKSECSEEGQVTYNNGSSSTDKACRCDYTKGYSFVIKPREICYCLPSKDDCSCYKTNCTDLSPDYECNKEGKLSNKPRCPVITKDESGVGNGTNMTKVSVDINSYDDYNIGKTTRIIVSVFILLIGFLYGTAVLIWKIFSVVKKRKKEKDQQKKSIHDAILRGEHGKNHFVRIIFVGKNGVGKTSLMRRLLWESGQDIIGTKSTDGIDIRKCRINVETGKWIKSDGSDDTLGQLIRQTFAQKRNKEVYGDLGLKENVPDIQDEITNDLLEQQKEQIYSEQENPDKETRQKRTSPDHDINTTVSDTNIFPPETTFIEEGISKENGGSIQSDITDNNLKSKNAKNTTISKEIDEKDIENITDSFLKAALAQSDKKLVYETYASCWLWDFAGQKDFYATHQAFLSSCAVFLLVTDSSDIGNIDPKQDDFEDAVKHISFWFDTIHCYWSQEKKRDGKFDPPVIVVCTHDDKCKDITEKERRKKEFPERLYDTIENKEVTKHIEHFFHISNTADDDTVFEAIRQKISGIAMNMKGWGNELPLKWILFEQILQEVRNEISILPVNTVRSFAKHKDIGITDDADFDMCLQYYHDIGNIIYFNEDRLRDQVILNPKWLVDAFRCLVSDKIDPNISVSKDWNEKLIKTGEITDWLLTELLKKKSEFEYIGIKSHLIEVMKKFDIVVQIKDSEALYMPCMMAANYSKYTELLTKSCIKSSWCCFEFDFLPPAFFNHILAWYIRKYNVSREADSERFELYRGVAVFNLDDTRCEQLIVCEAKNIVAIQVHVYEDTSVEDRKYGGLKRELNNFITNIKNRYKMNLNINVSFKCGGDFRKHRWTLQKLKEVEKYHCSEHQEIHIPQKIYLPWCELDEQSPRENIDDISEHRIRDVGSHNKPYILGQDIFRLHHQIDLRSVLNVDRIEDIIDGVMMDDGRLVLCLQYLYRLLICNTDGSEVDSIPLQNTPRNVTAVNNSTVAVTLFDSDCIEMYDINNKHKLKSIYVPGGCCGITTINNKLVVGCWDGRLLMIDDQTGEVVQTIHTDYIIPVRLHTSGDRIFYFSSILDGNDNNLNCYSYTDDKVTTLTLPSKPYSITSLQDGSLYVVCRNGSVQHVSSDVQHYKPVKTKGLKSLTDETPINYNLKRRQLMICDHSTGSIKIFDEL